MHKDAAAHTCWPARGTPGSAVLSICVIGPLPSVLALCFLRLSSAASVCLCRVPHSSHWGVQGRRPPRRLPAPALLYLPQEEEDDMFQPLEVEAALYPGDVVLVYQDYKDGAPVRRRLD